MNFAFIGPMRCGKDTAAEYLISKVGGKIIKIDEINQESFLIAKKNKHEMGYRFSDICFCKKCSAFINTSINNYDRSLIESRCGSIN